MGNDRTAQTRTRAIGRPGLGLPGIVLGVGLGGFADGIMLHQVLQWHHMLSSTDTDSLGLRSYPVDTVRGLQINTLWDGVFHVVTWVAVLTGLALLLGRVTDSRARVWRSRPLWGWALIGWGLFNVVEGVVDHHLLGIHHVRGGPYQTWWDLGFLLFGGLLIGGGWLLRRGGDPVEPGQEPHPPTGGHRRTAVTGSDDRQQAVDRPEPTIGRQPKEVTGSDRGAPGAR